MCQIKYSLKTKNSAILLYFEVKVDVYRCEKVGYCHCMQERYTDSWGLVHDSAFEWLYINDVPFVQENFPQKSPSHPGQVRILSARHFRRQVLDASGDFYKELVRTPKDGPVGWLFVLLICGDDCSSSKAISLLWWLYDFFSCCKTTWRTH